MTNSGMKQGKHRLKRTMRIDLADEIRERILGPRYEPGTRIVEEEISSEFGISRSPVREALVILEQEGLVEIRAHQGTFVAQYNRDQIVDLLRIEAVTEGLAASLAAQRVTSAEIANLHRLHDRTRAVVMGHNTGHEFYEEDRAFHHALVTASGSPMITQIIEKQLAQIYLCRHYTIHTPERHKHSLSEHERIVDALEKRDPELAEAMTRQHLQSIIRDFLLANPKEVDNGIDTRNGQDNEPVDRGVRD